jgi:hypothetical protein
MPYKLKKSVKYKLKNKKGKYKTKNNYGVQQIVKINLEKTKTKRKPRQRINKPILTNKPTSMALNSSYIQPQTFNDTITSHKLGILELEALETKNNIIEMTKNKPFGAIEGERNLLMIEGLKNQYEKLRDEYNETKLKAGMMFGKIGSELETMRTKKTLYPPKIEESSSSSSAPPEEEPVEEKPEEEEEEKPEEEKPEKEPEKEPEEEKPKTIYYNSTSMKSNISKILGSTLQKELREKLKDTNITVPDFINKMYTDSPDIGFTESKTERNNLVIKYVKSYLKRK